MSVFSHASFSSQGHGGRLSEEQKQFGSSGSTVWSTQTKRTFAGGFGDFKPTHTSRCYVEMYFFLRGKSSLVDVRSPNYFILARSSGA